jgi:hypothetical protein
MTSIIASLNASRITWITCNFSNAYFIYKMNTGHELKGRGQDFHLTHVQPQFVWLLKNIEVDANLEGLLARSLGVMTPVHGTWCMCSGKGV